MFQDARVVKMTRRSYTATELAYVRDSSGLWTIAKKVDFFFSIPEYPGLKPGKYALVESYQHGEHTRRMYRQRYILMDDPATACDAQERLMNDPNKAADTVYFVLSGDGRSYNRKTAYTGSSRFGGDWSEIKYDLREAFLLKPKGVDRPPAIDIQPLLGEGENGTTGIGRAIITR